MPIYVTKPSLPDYSDYIEEIKPIFESHILTNSGPVYQKLHNRLKEYLEVPELSLFVNGHMALEMAIQVIIKGNENNINGGEVITTPFTFVSTTHAITRNNLKPVFCDIKKTDYCIDPEKIEELITEKTVAIIPVHVYGNICDVEKIEKLAQKYNLKVIYDGAHAFGEKYNGISIGNFGDATMFSFHATKVFNTIEGGAVAFHDARYKERLHEVKNFGIHNEDVLEIGGNAKLDEFRAAMGICNLKRIDESIASRKQVFNQYVDRLSNIKGLILNSIPVSTESNYAYFPVLIEPVKFGKNRDQLIDSLKEQGIFARKYFYPAVNDMECYQFLNKKNTPIAQEISKNILTLPIYEGLSVEEVDRICRVIENWYYS